VHRLNRTEYGNAVHDLLALDIDAASLLPADDSAYGFDNVADVLGVSPLLLERYISAAGRVSALAVGDPEIGEASETFRVRRTPRRTAMSRGCRSAPWAACWRARRCRSTANTSSSRAFSDQPARCAGSSPAPARNRGWCTGAIGDVRRRRGFQGPLRNPTLAGDDVDGRARVRVKLTAGPTSRRRVHRETGGAEQLAAAALRALARHARPDRLPAPRRLLGDRAYNATGSGDTRAAPPHPVPARDRGRGSAVRAQHRTRLARQASRTGVGRRHHPPDAFYAEGGAAAPRARCVQLALQRMLASAKFARAQRDPAGAPGAVYALTDLDVAWRLSFFL
jgi:hypothetical protein